MDPQSNYSRSLAPPNHICSSNSSNHNNAATKNSNTDGQEKTQAISERRRVQNRIAQRRYRENAKVKKDGQQPASSPSALQPTTNFPLDPDFDQQITNKPLWQDLQAQASTHPAAAQHGLETGAVYYSRISPPQQGNWQNEAWQSAPDIYPTPPQHFMSHSMDCSHDPKDVHGHQEAWSNIPAAEGSTSRWSPCLGKRDTEHHQRCPSLTASSLDISDEFPVEDDTAPTQTRSSNNMQVATRASPSQDISTKATDGALLALMKQNMTIQNKGAELFKQLSELYNVGVLLQLIAPDSQFSELIETTRDKFFFLLSRRNPSLLLDPANSDSANSN